MWTMRYPTGKLTTFRYNLNYKNIAIEVNKVFGKPLENHTNEPLHVAESVTYVVTNSSEKFWDFVFYVF